MTISLQGDHPRCMIKFDSNKMVPNGTIQNNMLRLDAFFLTHFKDQRDVFTVKVWFTSLSLRNGHKATTCCRPLVVEEDFTVKNQGSKQLKLKLSHYFCHSL